MVDMITEKCKCYGHDKNGVRRVFGLGPTNDIAETRCKEAAKDYVKDRPDTGPLSEWSFR